MDVFFSQPVNYQHPLNRGLRSFAYRPKGYFGKGFLELCNPGQVITVSSGCSLGVSVFGARSILNSSGHGIQIPVPSRVHGGVSATLAVLSKSVSAPTQRMIDTKGGTDDYWPYFANGLYYTGALRTARVDGITTLVTATEWHWTYITTDGTTWTMYEKQVNSPLQVTTSTSAQSTVSLSSTYYSLGYDGGGGNGWVGNFQGALLWNRCLPKWEIHAHTQEWQKGFPNLINRKQYTSWYIPISGGGGGLAANPLYGGGAAASPLWGYIG